MVMDLSGRLDPEREQFFADPPGNLDMRDSASFWVFDDAGVVSLPRIGVEAVASKWENHQYQINVAFADGRVFRIREKGKRHSPIGSEGNPTVLGAGPLEFRCLEPFRVWTATFDGTAMQTSTVDSMQGTSDGPRVGLQFRIEATMAVPPWISGELSAESDVMGGARYEQLFRAVGVVRVGGDEQHFTGSGTRVRRQG